MLASADTSNRSGVAIERRRSPMPYMRATTAPAPSIATDVKAIEGWDANFFNSSASIDSMPGTGRIIRRYRFNNASSRMLPALEKRLPQLSHFDVKVGKLAFDSPSQPEDVVDTASTVPSKCDYLRVYYSDFLGQTPTDKPLYADTEEHTIESEELQKWVLQSHPRSRTEAYPLYMLTKDILRRVATSKCKVINTTLSKLREELRLLLLDLNLSKAEAESVQNGLLSKIADLEQALVDEGNIPKGGSPEDMARLAQFETEVVALKKEMEDAKKTAEKAAELAEKAKKDADKFKKEATAAIKSQQETAMKLKKSENLVASLQSGADQDPLDSMTDDQKCVSIKRLLTDDAIFKTKSFSTAVSAGLEGAPPKGCPNTVKRHIVSRLLQPLCNNERTMEGGTSVLALISRLISTDETPVTIYELLQECILKEVAIAPVAEQASFVEFLGTHWFAAFESSRSSLDKIANEFVESWGGGGGGSELVSRTQVMEGLSGLGLSGMSSTKFLRCAAGDRWYSMQVQANELRADGKADEALALENCLQVTLSDIRKVLQPGSEYHSLVQLDIRQAELKKIVQEIVSRELGGFGVGNFLASEHAREDSYTLGFPGPIAVFADLVGEDKTLLMLDFARMMPGEAMALAKQDSKEANKQRRSMLRYASVMVSREKTCFLAWRDEFQIAKHERAEEAAAQKTEQARQKKMKKPGTRNMSMYDGGKPTAVKTLGTQIGAIYEGKVVSDELMDKSSRPRESMPDFLKNFFIRQYGLKSIAVKNLANLAAGVRKEAANNIRLKLFGQLAGIIEAEEFQDGKCDMMMEGLKALFPTDQIKERLEGSPQLPISSLAFATLASFNSKYYFTDEDDLAMVDGESDLHSNVKEELIGLAGKEEGTDPDTLAVGIDKWMDWLMQEYSESRGNAGNFFAELYTEYDTNKDNCLDLTEFTALIRAVAPNTDDMAIMEMYNLALDCTGEGDDIAQDAFVYVAMHFQLPCTKIANEDAPTAS